MSANNNTVNRRFSVAPMMEWTDRHCRFFHRLLTRRALLYTEMLTTGAVLHGDRARLLRFDRGRASAGAAAWRLRSAGARRVRAHRCGSGFDEINLNAGCPSDRVQDGRFGACLMAEPALVGDCVAAMKAAVSIPVTVKCRIGIDEQDPEPALENFTRKRSSGQGPMRSSSTRARPGSKDFRQRRTARFRRSITNASIGSSTRIRDLTVVLNGGIGSVEDALTHLQHVDGVMMGRAAYQEPWRLLAVDPLVFGEAARFASREGSRGGARSPYIEREIAQGTRLHSITRHLHGLFRAVPGARAFRRHLAGAASTPHAGAEYLRCRACIGRGRRSGQRPAIWRTSRPDASVAQRPEPKMLLGVPLSEIAWLALAVVIGGVITGILAGLFGIGGGAVIVPVLYEVFSRARSARGRAHAALRRHLDRHHLADHGALLSHAPRKRPCHPARDQAVGASRRDRRHLRRGDRRLRAAGRVQDRLRADRRFHRHQISVRRRSLESRHRSARHGADDALRLRHRACRIADGRERRLAVQHRAHALRQADPQRGRDLGGARRADHHRRHASAIFSPVCTTTRCCRRCRSASSR